MIINNCTNTTPITQLGYKRNLSETDKYMTHVYLKEATALGVCGLGFLVYRGYANSYKVKLAKDLSKELGKKITTKDLKSVLSKREFLKELPKLREQNYVASENNLKNGIFLADLHSHSNHSDGQITVEALLNQAAEYGNKLKKINGKEFLFALTDHDGIDGVKEALKIIAKNPDKYKNVKFIPAAEISFVLPCQENSIRYKKFKTDVQMPEVLIYGINPFSKTTTEFFDNIYKSRQYQIDNAITNSNNYYHFAHFSEIEYEKCFNPNNKKLCFLNQHWKIWNYIHTKSRVIQMAFEQNKNPEELYEMIFNELRLNNKTMTPFELNQYIKDKNIQTKSKEFDENLTRVVLNKIFPHKTGEMSVSTKYELKLSDIGKYSKKENAVMGFAHPGFTMQNFAPEKQLESMKQLIKESNGQIKLSEKFHQAYPIGTEISTDELKQYNKILDDLNLINIGGRDNHTRNFI